jgi:DNA-directed RNA polymerase specialized sigma24 family protein
MMRRRGKLWLLDPAQWWRCRHWRLWRGRGFDPHDSQQVTSYAVMILRGDTRDVFLLSCVQALDYGLIGRHLGLTVQAVETHMAAALCQLTSTLDLIERVRPRRVAASSPEARHV